MQIIVIRHAQTEYNKKELINGSLDDDLLSRDGLAQMPDIIHSLEPYDFDTIFLSPMRRSMQTAKPIAEHFKLNVHEDRRLSEVNLDSFKGQGWNATIPAFGLNSSGVLSSCAYDFYSYGGESANETRARVRGFIDDLQNHSSQKPLIVSHRVLCDGFIISALAKKPGASQMEQYTFEI